MAETTSGTASGTTSGMAMVYRVVVIVTTLAVVVQFFLAGMGAFHDVREHSDSRFSAHETFGYVVAALTLLTLVAALLARMDRQVIGLAAAILILAAPVQILLAKGGTDHNDVWGALHGLVGAGIVASLVNLIRMGRKP